MRFLLLRYPPDRRPPPPLPGTAEHDGLRNRWKRSLAAMADAGVLIDEATLEPASAARTVRVRQGLALFSDGPANRGPAPFDGYLVLECDDLEEALRWAATVPTASGGAIEVRPAAAHPMPNGWG